MIFHLGAAIGVSLPDLNLGQGCVQTTGVPEGRNNSSGLRQAFDLMGQIEPTKSYFSER